MNRRKKDDLAFTELEKAERSLKEAKDKEKTDGSDDEVSSQCGPCLAYIYRLILGR